LHAIQFLSSSATAHAPAAAQTRYGLLAPDLPMVGWRRALRIHQHSVDGSRVKAVADAGERLKMNSLKIARTFYDELHAALVAAIPKEMVRHPDASSIFRCWHTMTRREGSRALESTASARLSGRCRMRSFPGLVFDKMIQSSGAHRFAAVVYAGDVPAETGWLWHESVWNYNASFARMSISGQTSRSGLIAPSRISESRFAALLRARSNRYSTHSWVRIGGTCAQLGERRVCPVFAPQLLLEDGSRMRLLAGMIPANFHSREVLRVEIPPAGSGA